MHPTAQQIIDSPAWQEMVDNLTENLREQFLLAPAKDPAAIQFVRLRYDALRAILSEMDALARAEPR